MKSRHHDSSEVSKVAGGKKAARTRPEIGFCKNTTSPEISCVVKNKKHQNSAVMLQFSGTNLHACFPGVQAVCTQVAHSCRVKAYVAYFTTPTSRLFPQKCTHVCTLSCTQCVVLKLCSVFYHADIRLFPQKCTHVCTQVAHSVAF